MENNSPLGCLAKPLVAFAHLGCEKNRVDTEHMLGLLDQAGYNIKENEAEASVVVVVKLPVLQITCSVAPPTLLLFRYTK